MRAMGILIGAAMAVLAPPGAPALPQERPAFSSAVELVQIDAVVLDHQGKPVAGLRAEDFQIEEDGHRRPIVSFQPVVVDIARRLGTVAEPEAVSYSVAASPDAGRYYLIYFDDVHMSMVNAQQARAGLKTFLEKDIRDGDWVTLVAPAAHVWWTARTPWEHRQLPALLPRLEGQFVQRHPRPIGDSDYGVMREVEFGGAPSQAAYGPNSFYGGNPGLDAQGAYVVTKRRLHVTLGTLRSAVESLLAFRGRKSLILYSGGFVRSPSMAEEYDRVIDAARRANVTIDFIDVHGLNIGGSRLETEAAGSGLIAAETGGRSVAVNDLEEPVRQAIDESSAYYLLGFEPGPGRKDERRVRVRVARRGLEVRARTRYFLSARAPSDDESPNLRSLRSAFDSTDLPIRVGAFFGAPGKEGIETTLAVDAEPPAHVAGRLNLTVELRARDATKTLEAESGISLASGAAVIRATLAPGVWQARVVVRDPESGNVGSALHTFDVPAASGLRISTPVVTDALEADGSPRIELEPTFTSAATLHCRFEVFGAVSDTGTGSPKVTESHAIESDSRTLREGTPTERAANGQGRILGAYDLPLSGLAAGAYVLLERVTDDLAGTHLSGRTAFTIVPQ